VAQAKNPELRKHDPRSYSAVENTIDFRSPYQPKHGVGIGLSFSLRFYMSRRQEPAISRRGRLTAARLSQSSATLGAVSVCAVAI